MSNDNNNNNNNLDSEINISKGFTFDNDTRKCSYSS